jgi:FkbH-like protein
MTGPDSVSVTHPISVTDPIVVTGPIAVTDPGSVEDLLARARSAADRGDDAELSRAVGRAGEGSDELPVWLSTARLLARTDPQRWARRRLRVAVLGSHTTGHLTTVLPVAMARHAIAIETYQAPYGQYEQEILDAGSGLYTFAPDLVVLLVDERDLRLPACSADPGAELATETGRWTSLWSMLRERTSATVIQATFVPRGDDDLGHLALSTPGSRRRQVRALNLALGEHAPAGVHLLDAELVAASVGANCWADDRFWFLAKQAVGLGAVPALCRQLGRIAAAAIGLSRKIVVVDLDNTLWGGVIGEDGLAGIVIGGCPRGEAHQALQEHLLALRRRGVLLAVVSKNNAAEAREPFLKHPDMRLSLSDFVAFRAGWDDKPAVIRELAEDLRLGLDAFVFVDDNAFEREAVRLVLPEVDVVDLPAEVSGYARTLARHPTLEPGVLTAADGRRTEQYRALGAAANARAAASTPQEFLQSLEMNCAFAPVDAAVLARVVQLIGKTNQFNLTGRRHSEVAVQELIAAPDAVHLSVRMSDRFTDHGLVGVVLCVPQGRDLRVDTWLMSCRVLGRGAEITTMRVLTDLARSRGFRRVIGEFRPSGRNEPARAAYQRSGFTPGPDSSWVFDLGTDSVPDPGHISTRPERQPCPPRT